MLRSQSRLLIKPKFFLCLAVAIALSPVSTAWADNSSANTNRNANKSQTLSKAESKQARKERQQLKKLSIRQLKTKMKKGDRVAGLAIADQFAEESVSLASTPTLANSAAEDAVRWYSLAARKGVGKSKPIVEISVPPIRATRKRHK